MVEYDLSAIKMMMPAEKLLPLRFENGKSMYEFDTICDDCSLCFDHTNFYGVAISEGKHAKLFNGYGICPNCHSLIAVYFRIFDDKTCQTLLDSGWVCDGKPVGGHGLLNAAKQYLRTFLA